MEAEPPKAGPPKRKRRWLQFRLRTLMIVVTLLAAPLGYVGWQAKIVRERAAALEWLRQRAPLKDVPLVTPGYSLQRWTG